MAVIEFFDSASRPLSTAIAIGVPLRGSWVPWVQLVPKVVVLSVLSALGFTQVGDNTVVRAIASHICVCMHGAIANHCDCDAVRVLSTQLSSRGVTRETRVSADAAQCCLSLRCCHTCSFKNVESLRVSNTFVA